MATPPSRIYDVCADMLGAVLTRHGGAELPASSFVSAGAPPWDCELVSVWCERTYSHTGNVAEEALEPHVRVPAHRMRGGIFVVTICRCTPAQLDSDGQTITVPTDDEEDAAARVLYEDAQRSLNALLAAEAAGELGGCGSLAFDAWNPLGPDGGFVASELRVRASLATGL